MKKNSLKTEQKGQENGQIMGIKIDSSSMESVLTRVSDFVSHNSKFYIVTPNPELVLMAQKDRLLKNALNSADLSIPDGVGLKLAIPDLNIIKGRELFTELIKLAAKNNWKVFLLGGMGDEAALASRHLVSLYPNIFISHDKGPKINKDAEPASERDAKIQSDVIAQINKFAPQLLFVAFGNPKQEIWIHKQSLPLRGKNFPKLNIGGAMAVGGAFRYVAGTSKLPPKWMSGMGLEWLWRVFTEPYRLARILNAVIVFPLKVFWEKIKTIF